MTKCIFCDIRYIKFFINEDVTYSNISEITRVVASLIANISILESLIFF